MIPKAKSRVHANRARKKKVVTDPKFIVGILLILASLTLTTLIVNQARAGKEYYELTSDIAQGQPLTRSNLKQVTARVDSDVYLPIKDFTETMFATRALSKGELLTKNSVTSETNQHRRQVVVTVIPRTPTAVKIGSTVELWVVPDENGAKGNLTEAKLLTAEAIVYTLPEVQNRVIAERRQPIELSIPETQLANILEYANNQYQLVIVPRG